MKRRLGLFLYRLATRLEPLIPVCIAQQVEMDLLAQRARREAAEQQRYLRLVADQWAHDMALAQHREHAARIAQSN